MKKTLILAVVLCLALLVPVFSSAAVISVQDFESKTVGAYTWDTEVDGDTWPLAVFSFEVTTASAASGKSMKFTAGNTGSGAAFLVPGVRSPQVNVTGATSVQFWIDLTHCNGNGTDGGSIYPSLLDGDGTRFDMKKDAAATIIFFQTSTNGTTWIDGTTNGNPWGNIWSPNEAAFKGYVRIPIANFEWSISSDPAADTTLNLNDIRDLKFGMNFNTGHYIYVDDVSWLSDGAAASSAPPADSSSAPPADSSSAPPADSSSAPPADSSSAPPADSSSAPPAASSAAATSSTGGTGGTSSSAGGTGNPKTSDIGIIIALAGIASSGVIFTAAKKRK